jgi:hypothetical protein
VAASNLDPDRASVIVSGDGTFPATGGQVSLTLTYDLTGYKLFPWNVFIPPSVTVTALARHE